MRVLWKVRVGTAAVLLGLAPAIAGAQSPSPADLLKFRPSQPNVDYDVPADQAAIDACKVERVMDGRKVLGFALLDGQGRLLRRFIDTRGKRDLDQWCYYKDGFEVYRENDLDDDLRIDECRWLNAGGTRVAAVKASQVLSWKRISPEEASKVLTQALTSGDLDLLNTVMASPEELEALGLPENLVKQARADAADRSARVQALTKGLVGWNKDTAWLRFDGMMPRCIPADAAPGLKEDLTLYENAVVFAGPPNGQGNPAEIAYLQALDVLKIGDAWKFVELPAAINPKNPTPPEITASIRTTLFSGEVGPDDGRGQSPEYARALEALKNFDAQVPAGVSQGDKKSIVEFHIGRVNRPLREVVRTAPSEEERLIYNKQVADSVAAAYQTGLYPDGGKVLDTLVQQGGPLASYAAFRKILAEYTLEAEKPGANILAVQKAYLTQLEEFIKNYPDGDETPDALLQLASVNEFNGEEATAKTYYGQLSQRSAQSEQGKKAAGALRRLDLVGQPLALQGTGLKGETIQSARARGKTLLVVFWTLGAEQARHDLPALAKVYQEHRAKGFEVLGVCLDLERDKPAVIQYLAENSLPWPQVFEPGGMESRLANEYGIISLPTMFLVGPDGKVVNRGIRTADEVQSHLEKPAAERAVGLNLGER